MCNLPPALLVSGALPVQDAKKRSGPFSRSTCEQRGRLERWPRCHRRNIGSRHRAGIPTAHLCHPHRLCARAFDSRASTTHPPPMAPTPRCRYSEASADLDSRPALRTLGLLVLTSLLAEQLGQGPSWTNEREVRAQAAIQPAARANTTSLFVLPHWLDDVLLFSCAQ
jgi:hypothetical protein